MSGRIRPTKGRKYPKTQAISKPKAESDTGFSIVMSEGLSFNTFSQGMSIKKKAKASEELVTIISFDFDSDIASVKEFLYADAMIRDLVSLLNSTTLGLYDSFNRISSMKKLKGKFFKFSQRYDTNLESVFRDNRLVSSSDFEAFLHPNPRRFHTISKLFERGQDAKVKQKKKNDSVVKKVKKKDKAKIIRKKDKRIKPITKFIERDDA